MLSEPDRDVVLSAENVYEYGFREMGEMVHGIMLISNKVDIAISALPRVGDLKNRPLGGVDRW